MTRENERRARELLLAASKDWEERSFDAGVGTVTKALDEAEARGRPQWRPVSERPERGRYLVALQGIQTPTTAYTSGCGDWSKPTVTHWQELPPTPTTEEG